MAEVTELFAGVPVRDGDAAFGWYERVLVDPDGNEIGFAQA